MTKKISLDWMDDISDLDLPKMMQLEKGWHLFHVDIQTQQPEVVTIEIPDKKKGGDATKEVPQLVVLARWATSGKEKEWSDEAVPFWGMRAFKEIIQECIDDDVLHDGVAELKVRVTQTEDGKRSAEFKLF